MAALRLLQEATAAAAAKAACVCMERAAATGSISVIPPIILFIVFHLLPNNSIRCMERKLDEQKCREREKWGCGA